MSDAPTSIIAGATPARPSGHRNSLEKKSMKKPRPGNSRLRSADEDPRGTAVTHDPTGNLIDHLRSMMRAGGEADRTDAQLLEDYISRHDEAAVTALVRRHGPMVWGVCRRVLDNDHDAEDAFQAAFLVLVRKAASILPRAMVGNWLYGVAHQTALKARATTAKRRIRERQAQELLEQAAAAAAEPTLGQDLDRVLDQQLGRLPDKYRVVIVLCDLQGKSRKEAAHELKLPEGTLSSRLTTARAMLAKRLARRGVVASAAAFAGLCSPGMASSIVPPSVALATIRAAAFAGVGSGALAGISNEAAVLAEGVLRTMLLTKLKVVAKVGAVTVLSLGVIAGGLYMDDAAAQPGPPDKPPPGNEKRHEAAEGTAAAKAVAGLRIRLQLDRPKGDKVPSYCMLVLENVADTDLNVQMGYSLANGKTHHPAALRLLVSSNGDKMRTLTYSNGGVAGRLDPFVVPLPIGSCYTLRCSLDHFVDLESGERVDLAAKNYRITAELIGQRVTKVNSDFQGFTLMPFWQGTVRSNEVKTQPPTTGASQ
jgi:RNA polymerase sigma factor (sigma-70 family)